MVAAVLERAEMPSANLSGTNLEDANLEGASLKRAQLVSANLTGARLSRANLSRADLESACLVGVTAPDVDLREANLRDAQLDGANLSRAIFEESVLEGVFGFQVNLEHASLRGALLDRADLRQAKLGRADLRGVRCAGIRLDGADVAGARIHGMDFGVELPTALPSHLCDASRAGDGSEQRSISELSHGPRANGAHQARRYVGSGDVLKNAELVFGAGSEILVDGALLQCTITLKEDATLVIGESGSLVGCRVFGGCLRIHGQFRAPSSVGISRPTEVRVFEKGVVDTELEQHQSLTRFGFAPGCRLRLCIKTDSSKSEQLTSKGE
jgi:hypothetical protein